jgi:hypothetical protein
LKLLVPCYDALPNLEEPINRTNRFGQLLLLYSNYDSWRTNGLGRLGSAGDAMKQKRTNNILPNTFD